MSGRNAGHGWCPGPDPDVCPGGRPCSARQRPSGRGPGLRSARGPGPAPVGGDAFVDPGFQGLSGLADHVDLASRPGDIRTELITVATERLDDHLPPGWLPDLIKIDVEGAEHLVLRGALSTLQRAKPVVAFEHGLTDGVSEEIYGLLCDGVGLRMFNMDGDGPLSLAQFLDQLRTRWNWVAHR